MVWKIFGPFGEEIGTIVGEASGIGCLVTIPLLIIGWGLLGFLGPFFIIKKHPAIASIMLLTGFGSWISSMITARWELPPHVGENWEFQVSVIVLIVVSLIVNPILACVLLKD